ncbi:MAG: HAD family phosphatase [Tissierellia bacterium]|nr:HAD family phosphatase [Tissierellia bacterium]
MQAAIFDLDGTILDSIPFWSIALPEFFKKIGFDYYEELANIRHLNVKESCEYLVNTYNLDISAEELKSTFDAELKIQYGEKLQMKENAIDVLKTLKNRDTKMCLATATESPFAELVVDRFDLWKYFEFVHTGNMGDYNKNQIEYFYYLSEKMDSEPKRCTVFEDSLHCIETAKKAGMRVVAFTKDTHTDTIDRIKEISDIVTPSIKDLDLNLLYR